MFSVFKVTISAFKIVALSSSFWIVISLMSNWIYSVVTCSFVCKMSIIINMINSFLIFCIRSIRSTVNVLLLILIDEKFNFIMILLALLLSLFRSASHAYCIFCKTFFFHSELLFFILIVLMWLSIMWLFRLFAEQYIWIKVSAEWEMRLSVFFTQTLQMYRNCSGSLWLYSECKISRVDSEYHGVVFLCLCVAFTYCRYLTVLGTTSIWLSIGSAAQTSLWWSIPITDRSDAIYLPDVNTGGEGSEGRSERRIKMRSLFTHTLRRLFHKPSGSRYPQPSIISRMTTVIDGLWQLDNSEKYYGSPPSIGSSKKSP